MDGARRLLRSVDGLNPAFASPRAAFAAGPAASAKGFKGPSAKGFSALLPKSRARSRAAFRRRLREREESGLTSFLRMPGLGSGLVVALLSGALYFGAVAGGQYDQFVRDFGRPRDLIARSLGFGVDAVTIAGLVELNEAQILSTAGVNAKQSLAFLDVDEMRGRLLQIPLVKNVSVRKLFPDRLVIDVIERRPYGLWQKDGAVSIIAADGAPIDALRDAKFESLPFVVGEGANQRVDDYIALLDAAGDLRAKIRAGVLVSQRRWTLKMANGVEVMLPESNPKDAVAILARLEQDGHVIEKDVVSLDLRIPGKLYVRLTEEAAAAREAARAQHGKGART
jgi:cell division protein FtsQ